jgi:hypothetical protein
MSLPVHFHLSPDKLARLWRRLQPLAIDKMPLDVPPPRSTRFGSPLVLSRVHWVKPELVAEVKFLTWTDDNLLRQVVYEEGCARTSPRQRCAGLCRIIKGQCDKKSTAPPGRCLRK